MKQQQRQQQQLRRVHGTGRDSSGRGSRGSSSNLGGRGGGGEAFALIEEKLGLVVTQELHRSTLQAAAVSGDEGREAQ